MTNYSDVICGDKETDILYSTVSTENRVFCKIMWKSVLQSKWEIDDHVIEMYANCMLEN